MANLSEACLTQDVQAGLELAIHLTEPPTHSSDYWLVPLGPALDILFKNFLKYIICGDKTGSHSGGSLGLKNESQVSLMKKEALSLKRVSLYYLT